MRKNGFALYRKIVRILLILIIVLWITMPVIWIFTSTEDDLIGNLIREFPFLAYGVYFILLCPYILVLVVLYLLLRKLSNK